MKEPSGSSKARKAYKTAAERRSSMRLRDSRSGDVRRRHPSASPRDPVYDARRVEMKDTVQLARNRHLPTIILVWVVMFAVIGIVSLSSCT